MSAIDAAMSRLVNFQFDEKWLRYGDFDTKFIGKPELDTYYREYFESVREGLQEFDHSGVDRLFHGATAVIVVACKAQATLPKEDALLASQNILLAAHSMGLGSCLIGMAVEPMKRDTKIQNSIGVPHHEKVYSVIALWVTQMKTTNGRLAERRLLCDIFNHSH